MRRLCVALALLALPHVAWARSGQDSPNTCPTTRWTFANGLGDADGPSLAVTQALTPAATAGTYGCSLVKAECNVVGYTKIAFSMAAGAASSVTEVGIFTADGATRIVSTGPQATTTAVNPTVTGLPAFSLSVGLDYLVCWATSATATVQIRGLGTPSAFNNVFANTTFASGTGATQVAPFNAACSGNTTPYACCTGSGTGTCNGMADRTGVPGIAAASVMGPVLVLAP